MVSLIKKSHGKLVTFFYKYQKAIGFFSFGDLKREVAMFFSYFYWLRKVPYKQCFKIFKCMPIYFKFQREEEELPCNLKPRMIPVFKLLLVLLLVFFIIYPRNTPKNLVRYCYTYLRNSGSEGSQRLVKITRTLDR